MLDLKNCPFCGNDGSGPIEDALHIHHNEPAEWNEGHTWTVQCDKCTATMGYFDSEDDAIAAWNRRALQAVGPEPAVAVKPLEWTEHAIPPAGECLAYSPVGLYCIPLGHTAFTLRFRDKQEDGPYTTLEAAKAAAEADYASRIRSALVATPPRPCTCHPDDNPPTPCAEKYALGDCRPTPPAEPVVEAPQPANSVRGAAERVVSFDWSSNDPDAVAAVDALRAALAAKPAVKDDETVVLPRLTDDIIRAACTAHFGTDNADGVCITVRDRDWTFREAFKRMWSGARAALVAKDGRS